VRAVVLTGDGGDGGAPINFAEGKTVMGAPNSLRASAGGGGSSQARWSEARRSGMEEIEGEEGGGPVASRAASGERLGTWRGELGSATSRGGWRRALAQSHHVEEDGLRGPGSRQGARPAETVAGRASAT
jgi:hypothetical protein